MSAQRFHWPTMPFSREIHSGCAINTSIIIKAKPYSDPTRSLVIDLKSEKDIALHLTIPVNKRGNMAINSRLNGNYSSEIEKPIFLAVKEPFVLHIRMNQHAAEIYYNDAHIADFIHRVDPLEVKSLSIEGPIIIEEVAFNPPQGASLDPLPSYEEAFKNSLPPTTRPGEGASSSRPRNPTTIAGGTNPFSYTAGELPPKPKTEISEKKPPYPEENPGQAVRVQAGLQGQASYNTQVVQPMPQVQPQPQPHTQAQLQQQPQMQIQPQPYGQNIPQGYPNGQNIPHGYPGAMGSGYPQQPMPSQITTVPPPQLPPYNVYNPYTERPTTIVQQQAPETTVVYPQQTIIQQPYVVQPQIYPSVYGYSYPTFFYEGGYGHHHHHHGHHHHHC
ncbi:unnamed protein product [Auanema sp. JU1783]|nr:unnamed protein product [Auanema sp. JU1783]